MGGGSDGQAYIKMDDIRIANASPTTILPITCII